MKTITFNDDYNIVRLYKSVIEVLQSHIDKKDEYVQKYELHMKIADHSHNPIDVDKAKTICAKMGKFLPFVKDGTLVEAYKSRVQALVNEYVEMNKGPRVFGRDNCRCIPKRVTTIISFFNITGEYVMLGWKCTFDLYKYCPKCYNPLKNGSVLLTCTCGYKQAVMKIPNVQIDDGETRRKSTYKAPKNFKKEYLHVCGAISSITSDEEMDIRSYLYRARIDPITYRDIHVAMKQSGYTNYNNITLLAHRIAGLPLPPILDYLPIALDRFSAYFIVFKSCDRDGTNISNIHFLIRLFLWQGGRSFDPDWFRRLSDTTEKRHRSNAKDVCKVLQVQEPDRNWETPPEWDD